MALYKFAYFYKPVIYVALNFWCMCIQNSFQFTLELRMRQEQLINWFIKVSLCLNECISKVFWMFCVVLCNHIIRYASSYSQLLGLQSCGGYFGCLGELISIVVIMHS